MNTKFTYLYRDAGNYKNWGEVVFSNTQAIPIDQINERIESLLIDKQNFVASDLKLPDLHFEKHDPASDHSWHEFSSCTDTEEEVTDVYGRDITDVIKGLRRGVK